MKRWEEGKDVAGSFAGSAGGGVHMRKLHFEQRDAADLRDSDPGENHNHGHFQDELKKVGDQNAPQPADERVNAGEWHEDEYADEQCSVFRAAERVLKQIVTADTDRQNATLRDSVTEQHGGDADHGFDDPAQNQAIHQRAQIQRAKTTQKRRGLATIAQLDKLHVRQNLRSPPISREEKHSHHAGEAQRPPQPVPGDSVLRHQPSHQQRSIRGERRGHHGSSGQPPGNIAAGNKEFLSAAGGAAAIIQADEEIEEKIDSDDDPVCGSEGHDGWSSSEDREHSNGGAYCNTLRV